MLFEFAAGLLQVGREFLGLGQTRLGGLQLGAARLEVGGQRVALGHDLVAFEAHLLRVGPRLQRLAVGLGTRLLDGGTGLLRDLGGGAHLVQLGLGHAQLRTRLLQGDRPLLRVLGVDQLLALAGELLARHVQRGGELGDAPSELLAFAARGLDRGVGGLGGAGRLLAHLARGVALGAGRLQPGGHLLRPLLGAPQLVAYRAELGEPLLGLQPRGLTLAVGLGQCGGRLGPRLGQPALDARHAESPGQGDRQQLGDVLEPLDHVPGAGHLAGEPGRVLVAAAPLGGGVRAGSAVVRAVADDRRGVAGLRDRPAAVGTGAGAGLRFRRLVLVLGRSVGGRLDGLVPRRGRLVPVRRVAVVRGHGGRGCGNVLVRRAGHAHPPSSIGMIWTVSPKTVSGSRRGRSPQR